MKLTAAAHLMSSSSPVDSRESRISPMSSVIKDRVKARGILRTLGFALLLSFMFRSSLVAFANFGGDSGSDPTVGTLPMVGSTEGDFLDQTVTLCGSPEALRDAVVFVGGNGAYESIDLGDGRFWIRYYGDIQLELDLASVADVEVEIFTGFEGQGLSYAVGQSTGFGSVRRVPTGSVIRLDPIRFTNAGLLQRTLFIAGFHQIGVRTMTSLELMPTDGTVVIRQDV